ncbi:hypothetical protein F2Q69_00034301 [Brassica cretica]|uniref:Uncharacterized protein n=1 Tax=Brassica cretica TaxID=69181 RepID=A0A8S9SGI6_BRACR|nr:hypothetical protein F2Q69_00034301 [Brassica cretica]
MALITSAVSRNDEELCRDMFESFIEGMSIQPSPQYCRGVSHLNNVLKLTSPVALQGLEKKKEKGRVAAYVPIHAFLILGATDGWRRKLNRSEFADAKHRGSLELRHGGPGLPLWC